MLDQKFKSVEQSYKTQTVTATQYEQSVEKMKRLCVFYKARRFYTVLYLEIRQRAKGFMHNYHTIW